MCLLRVALHSDRLVFIDKMAVRNISLTTVDWAALVFNNPTLWSKMAPSLWPHECLQEDVLRAYRFVCSMNPWLGLVSDNNRVGASPSLAINQSVLWHHNQTACNFECKVLRLWWHRPSQTIRVFFDAKGFGEGEQVLMDPRKS